jgi:glycosyltransferase involved in cell wall biosynthesis
LGKPFIFGPVGGGEECPQILRKHLPLKYKAIELLRSVANSVSRYNPLSNTCFRKSQLILLKTSDNLHFIPEEFHHKCKVALEVGIRQLPPMVSRGSQKTIKILYAGRLVYWKGVHLAIKAYAKIVDQYPDTEFLIVGSGNDEKWIKSVAQQQKVYDKIKWMPYLEQNALFQIYQEYDLFLFPSLHDSSGGVVIEALSFGLPVICLDLGGPKEMVDSQCGCVVATKDLTESDVVNKLSTALVELINNPVKLAHMQEQAHLKASTFTWDKVIDKSYSFVRQSLPQKSMEWGLSAKDTEQTYHA